MPPSPTIWPIFCWCLTSFSRTEAVRDSSIIDTILVRGLDVHREHLESRRKAHFTSDDESAQNQRGRPRQCEITSRFEILKRTLENKRHSRKFGLESLEISEIFPNFIHLRLQSSDHCVDALDHTSKRTLQVGQVPIHFINALALRVVMHAVRHNPGIMVQVQGLVEPKCRDNMGDDSFDTSLPRPRANQESAEIPNGTHEGKSSRTRRGINGRV